MWAWLTNLWNKLKAIYEAFLKKAVNDALKKFIAEFKDKAIVIVSGLDVTALTNSQKREEAVKQLMEAAKAAGKETSESFARTLIELAVQYIKNTSTA